ncbi:hypothetical protein SDD30_15135 [Moorella naiadis]|uniref:hypothetical protein n=1 Tax=Moorella naiadis (nom. illeg.) TaxID=3093670 RepID=UPI003D9C972C
MENQTIALSWKERLKSRAVKFMLDRYNKIYKKGGYVLQKCCKETLKDYLLEFLWNEPEIFRLVFLILRMHYHLRRLVRAVGRAVLPPLLPVILLPKERRA